MNFMGLLMFCIPARVGGCVGAFFMVKDGFIVLLIHALKVNSVTTKIG